MSLFQNTADLKNYVGISNGTSLSAISINETSAFNQFLKPYYSAQFWAITLTAAAASSPSAKMAELLPYVKACMAKFMMLLWIPEGAVNIDDNGITVFRNDKLQPASDAKIEDLKQKYASEGYAALEALLEYLETNKAETDFVTWKDNAYTTYHDYLIVDAKTFKNYAPISGRRTYLALGNVMRKVELFYLRPIIQKALFDSLKTKSKAGILTGKYLEVAKLCYAYIANKTLGEGLLQLSMIEDSYGITITESSSTLITQARKAADLERIEKLSNEYEEDAKNWKAEIEQYLFDNAADLTEFVKPTTVYVAPIENTVISPNFYN